MKVKIRKPQGLQGFIDYEETEASCIVKCHDVVVVCTGDGFPYSW